MRRCYASTGDVHGCADKLTALGATNFASMIHAASAGPTSFYHPR